MWAAGEEWTMRLGPADGPVIAVALPLLEEANRTRAVAVAVLRALAARGIAGALPELPGQGESLVPTGEMTLAACRAAFAGAVAAIRAEGRPVYVAAIRSGALLDADARADGRWHLAPQDGTEVLRGIERIARAGRGSAGGAGAFASVAGNVVARSLLAELAGAGTGGAGRRVVRLDGDPRPADRHLPGTPPWRRAEPVGDDALATRLADDVAGWMRHCAAR